MNAEMLAALEAVCEITVFQPGDVMRYQGGFAHDMYFILEGEADIRFEQGEKPVTLRIGSNSIIGEMGYLSGKGATARAEAVTAIRALAVSPAALRKLEQQFPQQAADFSRYLAAVARSRHDQNRELLADVPEEKAAGIEVLMCNTPALMRDAQRVRYDVYCGEFGRESPYADHGQKVLIDDLDVNGVSFLAFVEGTPIGTSRINLARDGELAGLPELYGMAASAHHPAKTCVITKYAIREPWRGGATYMRIFGAMATYLVQAAMTEIYIDCVPKLARFYATMGFRQCEAEFVHYENGLSVPMVLDIPAYFARMPLDERRRKNRWR